MTIDYHAIAPELILSGTIVLVLVVDAFVKTKHSWVTMPVALAGVVATLVATLTLVGQERTTFDGMFVVDNFTVLFQTFFLGVAIVVLLISYRYFRD